MKTYQRIVYGTLIGLASLSSINNAYSQQSSTDFITNPANPLYMLINSDHKKIDSTKIDSTKKSLDSLAIQREERINKALKPAGIVLTAILGLGSLVLLAGCVKNMVSKKTN